MYITSDPTHPSKYYDGEWKQIKDRFILAAGDSYGAGTEGGEAEVTLTISQMPTHTHLFPLAGGGTEQYRAISNWTSNANAWTDSKTNFSAGDSRPHNNMPPYRAYYVWERIA